MKYLIVIIISSISVLIRATINKHVKPKTKFCYNCKNCRPSFWDLFLSFPPSQFAYAKCLAYPKTVENTTFFVTGIPKPDSIDYYYCTTARASFGGCGPEGKDYVAKDGR